MTNENSGTTYQCNITNGLMEESGGWYNCSYNSSEMEIGWYTITFYTNRSYYNYGNDTERFYLSSSPQLLSPSVIPSSGGWGRTYNYTVTVTDEDNDTVTVYLWLKNSTGEYFLVGQDSKVNCSNTIFYFEYNYTKYEMGWWYYFFNACLLYTSPSPRD